MTLFKYWNATFLFFSGLAGIQTARQAARQELLSVLELTTTGTHYFEHACFISENDLFVRRDLAILWLVKVDESFKK